MSLYMKITRMVLVAAVLVIFPTATLWAAGLEDFRSMLADSYRTELNGFIEARAGARLQDDPYQKSTSVGEVRMQLDLTTDLDWGVFRLKGDLLGDLVTEEVVAELRELNLAFSPLEFMDLKLGRQVLTWGTGDLLFINDLFPKDWQSFFIGRDDEYLKAPSDALKASLFLEAFDLDLIYVPLFNGSVHIDGSRISYWPGHDFVFPVEEKNSVFKEDEVHLRLARNIDGLELAAYGYYGYWKTPEGVIPVPTPQLFYPRLAVVGASLRNTLLGGVGNVEVGYYDSPEDKHGSDPLIRNSEVRFLTGFERELARDLTGAFQYYLEYMQDYGAYEQTSQPATRKDEFRHLLTVRLTQLLLDQNLRLSLFAYYSPSDEDAYLRPRFHYKINDQLAVDGGINYFFGADDHTFFGQFEDATNIYVGVRWDL
jgi:hypothetical protein